MQQISDFFANRHHGNHKVVVGTKFVKMTAECGFLFARKLLHEKVACQSWESVISDEVASIFEWADHHPSGYDWKST